MDIITLYLLLGVASGVLHPAQGCKILVHNDVDVVGYFKVLLCPTLL